MFQSGNSFGTMLQSGLTWLLNFFEHSMNTHLVLQTLSKKQVKLQSTLFEHCQTRMLGSIVSRLASPTAGCRTSREKMYKSGMLGTTALFLAGWKHCCPLTTKQTERERDIHRERETDRHREIETDRQRERHTERERESQPARQTDRLLDLLASCVYLSWGKIQVGPV